jgi:hypothetical protein
MSKAVDFIDSNVVFIEDITRMSPCLCSDDEATRQVLDQFIKVLFQIFFAVILWR